MIEGQEESEGKLCVKMVTVEAIRWQAGGVTTRPVFSREISASGTKGIIGCHRPVSALFLSFHPYMLQTPLK